MPTQSSTREETEAKRQQEGEKVNAHKPVWTPGREKRIFVVIRSFEGSDEAPSQAWGPAKAGSHALQTRCQLGVLLLHLQLRPCRLRIRDGVDDFTLGPGQLSCPLEVLERLGNLTLLQEQLGHGSNRDVAFRVNCSPLVIMVIIRELRRTY